VGPQRNKPEDIMLDTLSRETASFTPLFEALQREGVPAQHRVVVHRPGSPRPALRVVPATAAPSTLPPSERGRQPAARPSADRAVGGRRPLASPPARLRLTRRGRLSLLVTVVALLFAAFSVGQVMTNAATTGPSAPTTHTVVVAPGDTAWSIARAAMPHLDGREAVDRLLAMNHSDGNIRVGQTLTVPGS
jgi:LysM repeat protein